MGDGSGGDGDDGRIFPGHPSPILHAPRDTISRKGKSLTPIKHLWGMYREYIYIYIYMRAGGLAWGSRAGGLVGESAAGHGGKPGGIFPTDPYIGICWND